MVKWAAVQLMECRGECRNLLELLRQARRHESQHEYMQPANRQIYAT
jgi:hypothetical protein